MGRSEKMERTCPSGLAAQIWKALGRITAHLKQPPKERRQIEIAVGSMMFSRWMSAASGDLAIFRGASMKNFTDCVNCLTASYLSREVCCCRCDN
jgi:hypothetical protein